MADEFHLAAELRGVIGKGASRRLRREADLVPAILYGAEKDSVPLSIPHKDLSRALNNEAFFSHIITLQVDNKEQQAILKAVQRHPAKPRILHVDFMRVLADQKINVEVPLHFINEENCAGVKQGGGSVSHAIVQLEVSCLPGNLPEFIEVDVEGLDIGDSLHLSDLVLPEGVEIPELALGAEHDQMVVGINAPRAGGDEEETESDVEEAGDEADSDE